MTQEELIVAIVHGITPFLKEFIEQSVSAQMLSVAARIDGVEKALKQIPAGPKGDPGERGGDAPPVDTDAIVNRVLSLVPVPKDGAPGPAGKAAEPVDYPAVIQQVLACIPTPKDGAPGPEGRAGVAGRDGEPIKGDLGPAGPPGPAGPAGEGVNQAEVELLVQRTVEKAMDALPKPRDGERGPEGPAGKDVDMGHLADLVKQIAEAMPRPKDVDPKVVRGMVDTAIAALPPAKDGEPGADGKDADPQQIESAVMERVLRALDEIPRPKDGRDGKDVDPEFVRAELERAVKALPIPKDGRDAEPVNLQKLLADVLAKVPTPKDGAPGKDAPPIDFDAVVSGAVARIPIPRDGVDGKSVTIEDLRPLFESELSKAILDLDRRNADALQRLFDRMPKPRDGIDGKDGLGVDDIKLEATGRTASVSFLRGGEVVKREEFRFATVLDCGIYRSGNDYEAGDAVTYARGLWIARRDTSETPGQGCVDWRLAVKGTRVHRPAALLQPSEKRPPNGAASE